MRPVMGRFGRPLASGATGALAFLLAEGLLRRQPALLPLAVQVVTGRQSPTLTSLDRFRADWRALQVSDPLLGFRYAPNLDVWITHPDFSYQLRTNDRGLRHRSRPGPVDAIIVGDSFAFAHGVGEAQAWQAHLQALSGLETLNLGVGGFGPLRELRLLAQEGLPLQPRLVIWQFFANDFEDAAHFQCWLESGAANFLAWEQTPAAPADATPVGSRPGRRVRRFLFRHAITYELAKFALGLGAYAGRRQRQVWVRAGDRPLLLDLAQLQAWSDFGRSEIRQGWRAAQQALLQARNLVEAAGGQFVVVMVPAKEEVYRLLLRGRDSRPQRRNGQLMAQFCRRAGLPSLDLHDRFVAAARQGQALYFRHDAHWNAAGHRLAAQALYEFLAAQGIGLHARQ